MQAKKFLNNSLNRTEETFQLNLSFIEMHIIMRAMSEYSNNAYQAKHGTPNYHHAEAAEKLHDEMTFTYCDQIAEPVS